MNKWFTRFAGKMSDLSASSWSFLGALAVVLAWAVTGPLFNFSDTWQLVINTTTSIVTFLMVFLIQNAQSRDAKALHLKLDEIIHVLEPAHDEVINVEKLSNEELMHLLDIYSEASTRYSGKSEITVDDLVACARDVQQGKKGDAGTVASGAVEARGR